MLAGSRVTDPATGEVIDLKDARIKAAVMFSPPRDGKDMAPWAAENFPAIGANDFSHMTLPSLVITGTEDFAAVFSERKDWRADAYRLSPTPKALLTLDGAGHLFGGISGYDAKETSDESPDRVAAVQRISWAYLRSALFPGDEAWSLIVNEITSAASPIGTIQNK